jgi:hypothetical protein
MLKLKTLTWGCLGLGLTAAMPALALDVTRPDKVSFYFAAHEDDWQLFMNPSAFQDVAGGAIKTVFVHVTAGDAGLGTGGGGRKHPLYLARENGAEAAIRFMADGDEAPGERQFSQQTFNGHPIYRVNYRNTVSYFLRVADGDASGAGFAATGFQSLKKLADGKSPLAAVDGSTVYRNWDDLVATVRGIIAFERGNASSIQLNVAETDERANPKDHSDHLMTAKAALDAARDMSCARRVYYVDYASSRLRPNLNTQQRDMESSVFAVTLAGVRALDHRAFWRHYDESFIGRNYFRAERLSAACSHSTTSFAAARH